MFRQGFDRLNLPAQQPPCCYCRGALTIFSWRLPALSLRRFRQGFSQLFMVADKMIDIQPPKQLLHQLGGVLSQHPGAACQLGYSFAYRQVQALDEGGVDQPRQAERFQAGNEVGLLPTDDPLFHLHQLAPLVVLDHLPI